MKVNCNHDLVVKSDGVFILYMMTDRIPIDYCPQCGMKLDEDKRFIE